MDTPKVAIVGAGSVGAMAATLLAMQHDDIEIVLVDVPGGPAEGRALDINQAGYLLGYDQVVVGTDSYERIRGAGIVVVTAGVARRPSSTRDDLLRNNQRIVHDVAVNVRQVAPDALIVVVTNPVEPLCHVVVAAGHEADRVIGMAGLVDSARFATFLAGDGPFLPRDVDAVVVGRHSDSHMVPLPSKTNVNGHPVRTWMPAESIANAVQRTRKGGLEILRLLPSGSTILLPAAAVAATVTALLNRDETTQLCVAFHRGENGISGLFMGGQVVVARSGVRRILPLGCTPGEATALSRAADDLRALLDHS
jgi:malate dehydrogenase